jgi:hypothetical protein
VKRSCGPRTPYTGAVARVLLWCPRPVWQWSASPHERSCARREGVCVRASAAALPRVDAEGGRVG